MGDARGVGVQGPQENDKSVGGLDDGGSHGPLRNFVENGKRTRFKPVKPRPSVGDRFGELTVVGFEEGPGGGLAGVIVRCSCGGEPYPVDVHNLRKGASTRCNTCAKAASAKWRKDYFKYADVVPDTAHRRRLLNRIAAAIGRCERPTDPAYHNYGGRGIRVEWGRDKRAFLAHLATLDGWDDPSLDLDRIDTDGNYGPGNLRFVSRADNQANRRKVPVLQARIAELEAEVASLRERLRHCERGAA